MNKLFAAEDLKKNLDCLMQAYPDKIKTFDQSYITWNDATKMPINDDKPNKSIQEKLDAPSLYDQLMQAPYPIGKVDSSSMQSNNDPGRIRYQPFFTKMYGHSESEVRHKLTTIYWMPKIFGKRYPLQITTVNSVDKKLVEVSNELETLVSKHPELRKYLTNVSSFNWRQIANTNRISPHGFGISIDLDTPYVNYWQWDLSKLNLRVTEETPLNYKNQIPWEIVSVFEKNGFIWGGKWHHYDTMHFEYRPELLCQ